MITFTVYGKPQPAGSKRAFARGGHIQVVDANKNSRPWKTQVAQVAGEAMNGRELMEGPLDVRLTFTVPRPKGHYGVHGLRPSAPLYPTTRPDVLKLARAVEDACTGVVWRDDAQIVSERLIKTYGEQACCSVIVGRAY
jgi:Holliday junction resolvase RusA-like endonuclease